MLPRPRDPRLAPDFGEAQLAGWTRVRARAVPIRTAAVLCSVLLRRQLRRVWWPRLKARRAGTAGGEGRVSEAVAGSRGLRRARQARIGGWSMNVEAIIDKVMQSMSTKTVIGEPMQIGSLSLIPIFNVSFGFGGGGGGDTEGGTGTGSGGGAR